MVFKAALEKRYPGISPAANVARESLINACEWFVKNGLADSNAVQRLRSSNEATYWQQLSEVLLAHQLRSVGISLTHQKTGPDFLIECDDKRIWIEVITPTGGTIPTEWFEPPGNGPRDFPHEEILLRWTAAIKQKAEVLLGGVDEFDQA